MSGRGRVGLVGASASQIVRASHAHLAPYLEWRHRPAPLKSLGKDTPGYRRSGAEP